MENQREEDRVVSSVDILSEIQKEEPQKSFSTNYYNLDRYTNGIKEGDLIILSGLTGMGKTAFAVSLARNFIEQNINCLFFSYEISSQELLERFGTPVPVFYLPRLLSSGSPQWIERKIIEAKENYGAKIIFIDHLHYLVDSYTTRSKNTSEMLAFMCREFKHIARKHRVVIVLLAHVRKFDSARPQLQDIKDSSGIIQEADLVLMIHRTGAKRARKVNDEEFELSTAATLYLDKVRRRGGRLGKINLTFDNDRFYEVTQ